MKSRDLAAALRLTRPRQWPILTAQLAVGTVLALPTTSDPVAVTPMLAVWLAWVVLLNGGTLAFNSAFDRDTGPVAYLRRPPTPPRGLAGWSLGIMLAGVVVGWLGVGPACGAVILVGVVLSVLYSHPRTRWKSRPGLDLLVNMAGYGAGTTFAGLAAGRAAGLSGGTGGGWFVAGFACLFGSFYPLTQIYQREEDKTRGDRTLATALGVRPALGLALVLGLAGLVLLDAGVAAGPTAAPGRTLVRAALVGWSLHLAAWWWLAPRWHAARHERGMYHALILWALVDLAVAWAKLG